MNTSTLETQPRSTNEKSDQGSRNEPHEAAPQSSGELAPDRPPQPVEAAQGSPKRRGFAAMDRKLVSEISRKGGKAAHSAGTAHEFTSDEARIAGRKGGFATHTKRRKAAAEPQEDHQGQQKKSGE